MQVKLLRHTPEPEKTVAMSARLCYSPIGAAQLEECASLFPWGIFPLWNM